MGQNGGYKTVRDRPPDLPAGAPDTTWSRRVWSASHVAQSLAMSA